MKPQYDKDLLVWYKANKTQADRIINKLRKRPFEGIMHAYAYTAKSLGLVEYVSQYDFPSLFGDYYTLVGDTAAGIITNIIAGLDLASLSAAKALKALEYWLVCGDMYETLVSKVLGKMEKSQETVERHDLLRIAKAFVNASILQQLKTEQDWIPYYKYLDIKNGLPLELGTKEDTMTSPDLSENGMVIPVELDTEKGRKMLKSLIEAGLCDERYHWKNTKALLAYLAEIATERLRLNTAVQDGQTKTAFKPFEMLFRVSGLSSAKNTYKNKTGSLPKGAETIDGLFW